MRQGRFSLTQLQMLLPSPLLLLLLLSSMSSMSMSMSLCAAAPPEALAGASNAVGNSLLLPGTLARSQEGPASA